MPTRNAWSAEARAWPPALAVCGWSGAGKTTLLEGLIRSLAAEGLRVAAAKHSHCAIEVDRPGKDTDRLFRAGADVIARDAEQVLLRAHPAAQDPAAWFGLARDCDLLLVEGHKDTPLPKVWIAGEGEAGPPAEVDNVRAVLRGAEREAPRLREIVGEFLTACHRAMPVWAAVLIGGAGRRMGGPKSLLRVGGEPLLGRVARAAQAACLLRGRQAAERVVLVGRGPVPDECAGFERLADVPGAEGPLGGLLAAMRWRADARWLVMACDMPFARPEAARWLLDQCGPGRWVVAPHLDDSRRLEPLFAVYDPPAAVLLEAAARRGERALHAALHSERVHSPRVPDELRDAWTNVNTPEEWREASR